MNHLYKRSGFHVKYCYNRYNYLHEEKENVIIIAIREHNRVQPSKSAQAIQSPFLCLAIYRISVYVDPLIKDWLKFRETEGLDDASSHRIAMHEDVIP
jgi:hypothetical protein